MLKQKRKTRRNPNSKDEKEKARQREIADFIATRGVTKVKSDDPGYYVSGRNLINNSTRLKERQARCQLCDSWTDSSGEFRHYDWCPTYKTSRKNPSRKLVRKNPITSRKSDKQYKDLIQVDTKKTSRSNIFLTYKGKKIEFTGKDAEELRDILKYQLKNFRGSAKLQKLFPKHLDEAGGFDTYITEQLQKVYPEVFG
jgi:hypothetical protein